MPNHAPDHGKNAEHEFLRAYDQYADAIYRHCYFRVYDKPVAEDLTQETFMKTWKYLSEGKEVQNIKAFLYRVALNLIIDYRRKKTAVPLDDFKEREVSFRLNTVEEQLFSKADLHIVRTKIELLETKYRDIILMRYLNDLSPAEISGILGISANVVSVRLNYAVKKLRKIIEHHQG